LLVGEHFFREGGAGSDGQHLQGGETARADAVRQVDQVLEVPGGAVHEYGLDLHGYAFGDRGADTVGGSGEAARASDGVMPGRVGAVETDPDRIDTSGQLWCAAGEVPTVGGH